jgi:hypothetical protein
MLQAFEWVRRRAEREREEKEKKMSDALGECHKYPITNSRNDICKVNGKKEEKRK